MEPRNYRLYNGSIRAVSPSISDWSPMVLSPSNDRRTPLEEYNDDDALFPLIRRSFAFDEWDNNDKEEDSPDSFNNRCDDDDDDEGTRYGSKTLVIGIPSVINGRTIYDATGGPFPFEHHHIPKSENPTKLAPLETYMTVIHLDDTQMIGNNKASCTSTSTPPFEATSNEDKMDNFLRFSNTQCPPIFRNSTTYRWTTMGGHSFPNVHGAAAVSSEPALDTPPPCLPFLLFSDREDPDDHPDEFLNSSSSSIALSDIPCPIPEYIYICMNE